MTCPPGRWRRATVVGSTRAARRIANEWPCRPRPNSRVISRPNRSRLLVLAPIQEHTGKARLPSFDTRRVLSKVTAPKTMASFAEFDPRHPAPLNGRNVKSAAEKALLRACFPIWRLVTRLLGLGPLARTAPTMPPDAACESPRWCGNPVGSAPRHRAMEIQPFTHKPSPACATNKPHGCSHTAQGAPSSSPSGSYGG